MKHMEYGICPQCNMPKDREGYYCSFCAKKNRMRRQEDVAFYLAHGLCRICGKRKSTPGTTYCEECSQRLYEYTKKRYERDPDYFRRHNRQSSKKRYEECKAMGICTRCRKRKAATGRTQCPICLEKDALKHKYWYKKKGEENAKTKSAM